MSHPHPEHVPPVEGIELSGTEVETGEPIAIVAMETPVPVMPAGATQHALERVQLERYRVDYFLRTGVLRFDDVRRGDDPPDFIVSGGTVDETIDLAALGLEERRKAYGLFRRFRERLFAATKEGRLAHLRGTLVNVWFLTEGQLPPKATDELILEGLLQELQAYRPDREGYAQAVDSIMRDGFPERLPTQLLPISTADQSAGCQIVPVEEGALSGPFSSATGFECQLKTSTYVRQSDIRAELNRLIAQHDKAPTQHLLLTLGGPDRNGLRYPSEAQLARLLLNGQPLAVPAVAHLRRVTLHCWTTGEVFEILT